MTSLGSLQAEQSSDLGTLLAAGVSVSAKQPLQRFRPTQMETLRVVDPKFEQSILDRLALYPFGDCLDPSIGRDLRNGSDLGF